MEEFPSHFIPENYEEFNKYNFDRNLAYIRKEIYELVIRGDKTQYFDLDKFSNDHSVSMKDLKNLVTIVSSELIKLGWVVVSSYGGSGLFVYTGDIPSNCYPDGF